MEVEQFLDELAGEERFWLGDTRQNLVIVLEELQKAGHTLDDACDIVRSVWGMAKAEYGQ